MKQQLMMLLLGTASVFCSCETQVEQHEKNELRAPAYPLVTIDPYTSAWSTTDNLYDSPVKHCPSYRKPQSGDSEEER